MGCAQSRGGSRQSGRVHAGSSRQMLEADPHYGHHFREHLELPLVAMIEHYQPPGFPMRPHITVSSLKLVKQTWEDIKSRQHVTASGMCVSGIVFYYDSFYSRLYDRADSFASFFGGDMKKKGQILIRIMEYVTSVNPVEGIEAAKQHLRDLGRFHNRMNIRPWMYSVFIDTMMTTIAYCLEDYATFNVVNAWTNLLSFCLREMLPNAIADKMIPTEIQNNAYAEDAVLDQADAQEADARHEESRSEVHSTTSSKTGHKRPHQLHLRGNNHQSYADSVGHRSTTSDSTRQSARDTERRKRTIDTADVHTTSTPLPETTASQEDTPTQAP